MNVRMHIWDMMLPEGEQSTERGILMKMKKLMAIAVSAALLVSMAAATAWAVESTPSKTGTDADSGKVDVSISGTGDVADTKPEAPAGSKPADTEQKKSLYVEVKATEDSAKEETRLKNEGVEDYLGAETTESAAKILDTSKDNVTVSEIKEVKVTGYSDEMEDVTLKVPFAALPEEGTAVAVVVRVTTPTGQMIDLPVSGIVVEETVIVNGVARKVRKVMFTLDGVTMRNVEAGKVYVAAVTTK